MLVLINICGRNKINYLRILFYYLLFELFWLLLLEVSPCINMHALIFEYALSFQKQMHIYRYLIKHEKYFKKNIMQFNCDFRKCNNIDKKYNNVNLLVSFFANENSITSLQHIDVNYTALFQDCFFFRKY